MNKMSRYASLALFLVLASTFLIGLTSASNFSLSTTETQTKSYPSQSFLDVIAKLPEGYVMTGKFSIGFSYNDTKKSRDYKQVRFNFYVEGNQLNTDGSLGTKTSVLAGNLAKMQQSITLPANYVLVGYGFQTKGSGKNYQVRYLEVYARKLTSSGLGSLETFKVGKKSGKLKIKVLLDESYTTNSVGGSSGKKFERISINGSKLLMKGNVSPIQNNTNDTSFNITYCRNITQNNSVYKMTNDILVNPGRIDLEFGNCLSINANNVIIDMQGHTLSRDWGVSLNAININGDNVSILNGMIDSFSNGIVVESSSARGLIENMSLIGNGATFGIWLNKNSNNFILRNILLSGGGDGILFMGYDHYLENVSSVKNSFAGIMFGGDYNDASNCSFKNIDVSNNGRIDLGGYGINLRGEGHFFENIIADNTFGVGIELLGSKNKFSNLLLRNNLRGGIKISGSNNDFSDISSLNNSKFGLSLTFGNNNSFSMLETNNNLLGVNITKSTTNNTFTNVVANNNSQYGIYLPANSSNTLINVTAQNNGLGDIVYY